MDIYGWTSRGPLLMTVVEAVVQWFATRRRVWDRESDVCLGQTVIEASERASGGGSVEWG